MASRLRRRAIVVPAAIALVAGGGAVAWGSAGGGGSGYRTAVVGRGDVQQLLSLTGTVRAVDQAKARFRTSGTVASVKVTVGQPVTKGQLLATMDTGALQDAVIKAKAVLAKAKATLEADSSSSSSDAATAAPTPSATPSPTRSASPLAAAQRAVDQALQRAELALAAATAVCATSSAPSASAVPSASPTASPTEAPAAPASGSCPAALTAALRSQQVAARAQQSLARALQAASRDMSNPTARTATPTPVGSVSQAPRNPAEGSSDTSVAARITTDTAAVSAAEVALAEAEKDLAAVSLRAPLTGTIASIPWKAGATAAAGDAIVVLGRGAVDVTVEVPATAIRSVRVGLPATVRADGASKSASGVVSQIGLLPTDNSSSSSNASTTTYPVTVRVDGGPGLVEGGTASVGIAVKTVRDVITVPNSALHGSTVDVLSAGKVSRVRVQTGTVGALVTEVTSGLKVGQTVVLADLGEALPTSSTTNNDRGFTGPRDGFSGPAGGAGSGPLILKRGG
ncbi:MAG: efflux RND transporter periplasmic adaptor subunit [Mycobacteriales bacterium]